MTRSPSTEPAEPAAFDVRAFARTAHGSLRDDLDLDAIARARLAPELVATLAALATLEGATMAHLRNVLVTNTHKDARVTAFLVTWAFEKFWIADALRAIVDASDGPGAGAGAGPAGGEPPLPTRTAASGGAASGHRGPVRRAFASITQGWAVVGAHMAVGLVDDRALGAAYASAAESSTSAAVDAAVERIVAVKGRHTRFFAEEVQRRLTASPRAARLARRELRRTAWPLGTATLTAEQRAVFSRFVFGGPDGHARGADVERGIATLPGMDEQTAATVRRGLAGRRDA
jgi:hypothetical protein